MMRIAILVLALAGCQQEAKRWPTPYEQLMDGGSPFDPMDPTGRVAIRVVHDDRRKVTCWVMQGGMSCLPDTQVAESATTAEAAGMRACAEECRGRRWVLVRGATAVDGSPALRCECLH